MSSIFDFVRDADAREVAQALGLEFPRYSKRAICPFCGHAPATLSFTRNLWHCFRCGAAGDSIKLVMEYNEVSALDAARFINEACACGYSEGGTITDEMRARIDERKRQQSRAQYIEAARKYGIDTVVWAETYLRDNAPSCPEEMTQTYLELLSMRHMLESIWQEVSARDYDPARSLYSEEVKKLAAIRNREAEAGKRFGVLGHNQQSDCSANETRGHLERQCDNGVHYAVKQRKAVEGAGTVRTCHKEIQKREVQYVYKDVKRGNERTAKK